jgi:hypothetical protein
MNRIIWCVLAAGNEGRPPSSPPPSAECTDGEARLVLPGRGAFNCEISSFQVFDNNIYYGAINKYDSIF